mgnify:CR=1 FL=1
MEKVGERMADISTEELERIEREYHSGSDNIKPIQEFSKPEDLYDELIASIRNLIFTLPAQINQLVKQVNHIQLDDSAMTTILKNAMNEASTSLQNWMRTDLLDKVNELMTHLTVGLYTLVMELFHAVIGVIVSVYILFGKETFINQSKKATYAIFPTERANLLIHIAVKTNEIFGGFIIGKIIDSIIIGILCFIGTSLLNMPYAMLVSVIVGVTNVIPFFGPYILSLIHI